MGTRDSQQGKPGHEPDPKDDIANRLVPSKDRQLAHVDHRKLSHLYNRKRGGFSLGVRLGGTSIGQAHLHGKEVWPRSTRS